MKVSIDNCWIITFSINPNKKSKKLPPDLAKVSENIYLDLNEVKKEVDKLNENNFNLIYRAEKLNEYIKNIQDDAYDDGQIIQQLYRSNIRKF